MYAFETLRQSAALDHEKVLFCFEGTNFMWGFIFLFDQMQILCKYTDHIFDTLEISPHLFVSHIFCHYGVAIFCHYKPILFIQNGLYLHQHFY